jgi:PAS domain-containing protein
MFRGRGGPNVQTEFTTIISYMTRNMRNDTENYLIPLRAGIYRYEPGVEGVFTWVNKADAEMSGYESPEEMIGTKVNDIYADTDDRRRPAFAG